LSTGHQEFATVRTGTSLERHGGYRIVSTPLISSRSTPWKQGLMKGPSGPFFLEMKELCPIFVEQTFSLMTKKDVKMMIDMSDADLVYTMLLDMEQDDLAEWVADKYF
jgi:hypothetical protein